MPSVPPIIAHSGARLLRIEATAVKPEGRITPGDLGLWSDETEAALRPVLQMRTFADAGHCATSGRSL